MYNNVDPKQSLSESEKNVLAYWQKHQVFEKLQESRKDATPFVFFEGPPTANGKPGIHHVESRSFKDVVLRFQTMRGMRVDRKAGWDTHGLPVELQVEKKLGLKNKKDIETYGIAKFNAECKQDVWTYKQAWEELTERIGFWLDLKDPYITYENTYIESVWAILQHVSKQKDALGREMLYEGHKVVPYCTRCGTALSSHEVAQGYKAVTENSVYVKFNLKPGQVAGNTKLPENTSILAWTTTPWTLPGNVALAVGNTITYTALKHADEHYIVAKDRVADLKKIFDIALEMTETEFDGSELVGLEYMPLFKDVIENNGNAYKVYAAEFVTTTDGTGVVHTAVMYGEDDYTLGTEVDLPKVHTVGEDGRFLPRTTEGLANRYVKDRETEKIILDSLSAQNLLMSIVPYTHDYPFCWRCDTALLYYARTSWFIRMSSLRDEMVKRNDSVNWEPASIKMGRMGEWLENAKDWAISRERYWGTPLPIWRCENGHMTVVGSAQELKNMGASVPEDLHRPFIDEVTITCAECQKEARRVLEVADVWLDSGAMPFAQWGYPHADGSEAQLKDHFPAHYITEAIDQTRGWFYTLQAVATLMGQESPYKNVICLGHVLDEHGKKMSKSRGNIVDPWEMIEKYGADALRFYFYSINPAGEPKLFTEKDLQTTQRKVMVLWKNIYSFFITYANEAGWDKEQHTGEASTNILDRWVISLLNKTIETTTKGLESYDAVSSARALSGFIDDLSTWWLRRSRDRLSGENAQDKQEAFSTLYTCLITLAQLMAPFTPFMAEETYSELVGESVHLSAWPEATPIEAGLLVAMQETRNIVSSGLEARMKAGIKVRQKLLAAYLLTDPGLWEHLEQAETNQLLPLIQDELNVGEVIIRPTQSADDMLDEDDPRYVIVGLGNKKVVLDTLITPELELDGLTRELIRSIQDLRKKAGLTVSDTCQVEWASTDEKMIYLLTDTASSTEIARTTRSTVVQSSVPLETEALVLNGHDVQISLTKI